MWLMMFSSSTFETSQCKSGAWKAQLLKVAGLFVTDYVPTVEASGG
jgi:hypothetical protein